MPDWLSDLHGSPTGYQQAAGAAANPVPLANAGGGLLLGAMTWVLAITYLRSGGTGVRALLAAKFLNKTSTTAKTTKGSRT
jgi:hypothetical protein